MHEGQTEKHEDVFAWKEMDSESEEDNPIKQLPRTVDTIGYFLFR